MELVVNNSGKKTDDKPQSVVMNFVKDVNEVGGVSIYHLVKLLYNASIEKGYEIKARCLKPASGASAKMWYYTEIGLYHERLQEVPHRRVIVAENDNREEVHLNYTGPGDVVMPATHHYRDLHDAVADIGFYLVKGRCRSVEERLANELIHGSGWDNPDA